MIDRVFTQDDLAYVDDDLETIIDYTRARFDAIRGSNCRDAQGNVVDQTEDIEQARRALQEFERLRGLSFDPALIAKDAFRVRAINDSIRAMLLDQHRGEIAAGYSPVVDSRAKEWLGSGPVELIGIQWPQTIRAALAQHEDDDAPPIRVPGFLLRGESIVSTRTLTPSEYQAAWERYGLDGYRRAWAEEHGQRRCLCCLATLPDDAHPNKRFCNDRCRNTEKQRRFRRKNPEAADRARKRYAEWAKQDAEAEGSPVP